MLSDRIEGLPGRQIFSLFFTAGYPRLEDTRTVLRAVQDSGVNMVEIGFPFSDPVADGPTIQASNQVALENGMTVDVLFQQLEGMRREISMPVLLMGYLNPMMQFGVERFLSRAKEVGIDALIIPDLPFEEYRRVYAPLFEEYGVKPVFLITRRTPDERIRQFDAAKPAFLYVVSSEATTGGRAEVDAERDGFFKHLRELSLSSKLIVGFGVADKTSFEAVTRHTDGAIVGSAFLRALSGATAGPSPVSSDPVSLEQVIRNFVVQYR